VTKRTYAPEFRATVVAQVEAALPAAASTWEAVRLVAARTGVPARTLVTWLDGPPAQRPTAVRRRPPGRPAGSLGAETRTRVLQVAQETIAELGTSASVREIAERCGLSGNALYHYFPTKADLVAAVTERNYEQFFGHLEAAARSGTSLADDLTRVVSALEAFLAERPWFPLVLARSLPGVFRRRAPLPAAATRLVDVIMERALERGELRAGERDRLEGLVAVILMGLTLSGPAVRDVSFESVRWMLEQFWPPTPAAASDAPSRPPDSASTGRARKSSRRRRDEQAPR
jgi:AcrR family transcriptional regulator